MQEDQAGLGRSTTGVLPLYDEYQALDGQRVDLDRRIMALPPDSDGRELLWIELEAVLAKLGDGVDRLAATAANGPAEVRAKAAALATLLRSEEGGGPPLPKRQLLALALSLTDDIAGLLG
jgi:hypothetical protein